MNLKIIWTAQFKKDYKLAIRRGLDIEKLDNAIRLLAENGTLPAEYLDHVLSGEWKGFHECHIAPDWLLIYAIESQTLVLVLSRTGTHSDLFHK